MKKALLVFLACSLLLSGCLLNRPTPPPEGLALVNLVTSLGGDPDQQTLGYAVTIRNDYNHSVRIDWAKPVLVEAIGRLAAQVPGQTLMLQAGQSVPPGEMITLQGRILLNTKGLTKDDMQKMSPFITGVQLSSGETLKLAGQ